MNKTGYIFFFNLSPKICLHASVLISQLVGSQEALLSVVLLRELQLYEIGGKCSLYELFFYLGLGSEWQLHSDFVCDSTKDSKSEKQVSK